MDIQKKKCSLKEHSEINVNIYCKKCEKYMCHKCEVHHSKLFEDHQNFILNQNIEEIFNEFCEERNHLYNKLNYFCKTHNKLCCASCIAKIKGKGDGQHSDCDVCNIDEIKEEKKKKIKENIKLLEELSIKFNENFNNINKIYEEINENKENLKLEIQNIFTKIRNILNNREDELLLNVDKEYNNLFFKGGIMKDIEKLPNIIRLSLEKCKNIDKINNIYKLQNECIEIENHIEKINIINSNINDIYNSKNIKIKFIPVENELNEFIDHIKNFGKIKSINNNYFKLNLLNLSSIIKDDINSVNLIYNWIEESINKKGIEWELIFKMSENGTKSSDFHKYCDNKGPTLTLIKTTKGKIFGGFTPLSWKNEGFLIKDLNNQTFIFSLNLKKKYKLVNENSDGIFCFDIFGPNFGGFYFWLKKNMKIGELYSNKINNLFFDDNSKKKGNEGEYESFEVDDFEVYKVMY